MSDRTTVPPAPADDSGWQTWPRLMELFQRERGLAPMELEDWAVVAVQSDAVRFRIKGGPEEVRWRVARQAGRRSMPSSWTAPSDFNVWSVGSGISLDGTASGNSGGCGEPMPHRLDPWHRDGTLFCVEDVVAYLTRELGQPFVLQGDKQAADQGPAHGKGGRPKSPALTEAMEAVGAAMLLNKPPDWAPGWHEEWPPETIAAIVRALEDWFPTYCPKDTPSESTLERAARELNKKRGAA